MFFGQLRFIQDGLQDMVTLRDLKGFNVEIPLLYIPWQGRCPDASEILIGTGLGNCRHPQRATVMPVREDNGDLSGLKMQVIYSVNQCVKTDFEAFPVF